MGVLSTFSFCDFENKPGGRFSELAINELRSVGER